MKFDRNALWETMLLYGVTDRSWLKEGETLAGAAELALKGGTTFLQLREKELDDAAFLSEARQLKELCSRYGVPFVINDNVGIALEMDADGVHVGQSDMEAGDVRKKIGPEKILGVSVQTVEQALLAQARGADYLGVGAVFPTGSKDDAKDVSHDMLQKICETVDIPVVAIGGIHAGNVSQLAGRGLAGIAVISAIFAQPDIEAAAADLKRRAAWMAMGSIRGAVFDVDGTLLDSSAVWDDAGAKYLVSVGIEAEEGLGRRLFEMSLDEGAAYMKETYHMQQSTEEILEGVLQVVEDFYFYEAPLKEGAAEVIHQLAERGIPMVIASSSKKEHIEAALTRLGIGHHFRHIFTCSEVGIGKHDPKIFLEACQLLGTRPEETWVFEDGLYAMKTAVKAGFPVVGVYDEASRADWEKIQQTAVMTVRNLSQYNLFWEEAGK